MRIVARAFGEPSVLQVESVVLPKLGKGQVLIKTFAAGVNPVC
jgi:NADPH:quinone reductase-like Zn-dependent oxidoreductase